MSTFAVIDIGSNGIRFGIATVTSWDELQRAHTARQAIRLGQDVFKAGKISQKTEARLLSAFIKFHRLAVKLGVTRIEAVATSAMREASNGKRIARDIQKKTGIAIRIIDGYEEARLLLTAVQHANPPVLPPSLEKKPILLIDIGGGSIELTVQAGPRTLGSISMPLGAVRLLQAAAKTRPGYDPVGAIVARRMSVNFSTPFPSNIASPIAWAPAATSNPSENSASICSIKKIVPFCCPLNSTNSFTNSSTPRCASASNASACAPIAPT